MASSRDKVRWYLLRGNFARINSEQAFKTKHLSLGATPTIHCLLPSSRASFTSPNPPLALPPSNKNAQLTEVLTAAADAAAVNPCWGCGWWLMEDAALSSRLLASCVSSSRSLTCHIAHQVTT